MQHADAATFDPWRILAVLHGTGADFIVVGSTAAWDHVASRHPRDVDCVIRDDWDNFERVAAALRTLHARPAIPELTDAEACTLPTRVDARLVAALPIAAWMTHAGRLDLLDALVDQRWQTRRPSGVR